jgi:dUTP pyrophosphatase
MNAVIKFPQNVGCFKLSEKAKLPYQATAGAACYDLYACVDKPLKLNPKERVLVPTGLIMDIPEGYSVRIHTRSSWAAIKGIGLSVSEGIIDSDYVKEVFVPMVNNTDKIFHINDGDRVAQCELLKNLSTDFTEVNEAPQEKTSRKGGFGSTGIG